MEANESKEGIEVTNWHLNTTSIESKILTIRGKQVILDTNLAKLYGIETKALNQAVKRNIERFPQDFMFQLTQEEASRSQFATLNLKRGQNLKYLPYAFTEQGIAMLSGLLRSPIAIEVNIRIMRTFVEMRHWMIDNANLINRVDALEQRQLVTENKIDQVLSIMERQNKIPEQGIFYDGQIFDAHSFVSDLIREACSRIVLIDNYIDDTVLKRLDKRRAGVAATIYTQRISNTLQADINLHNEQYPSIDAHIASNVHDRFLIIDDTVYHIGASIKDLGKKIFAFSRMNERPENLLSRLI